MTIGLFMFMDCKLAHEKVEKMKALTYIDGVIVCNVLIEGTTYLGIMSKTQFEKRS